MTERLPSYHSSINNIPRRDNPGKARISLSLNWKPCLGVTVWVTWDVQGHCLKGAEKSQISFASKVIEKMGQATALGMTDSFGEVRPKKPVGGGKA